MIKNSLGEKKSTRQKIILSEGLSQSAQKAMEHHHICVTSIQFMTIFFPCDITHPNMLAGTSTVNSETGSRSDCEVEMGENVTEPP